MRSAIQKDTSALEPVFDIGTRDFTFLELLSFAEEAGKFIVENPKGFHEAWQMVKDGIDIRSCGEDVGISTDHVWMQNERSWHVAKHSLPFFYKERLLDTRRVIEFRLHALDEMAYGHEHERGLLRLAFMKYQ